MARSVIIVSTNGASTATAFETAINAALAPFLSPIVGGWDAQITDTIPSYIRTFRGVIDLETTGGAVMTTPYQVKVLEAETEAEASAKFIAYAAANPTQFIAPALFRYSDLLPNIRQRNLFFLVFNVDQTNGQANWQPGYSGGGGSATVLYGLALWVDSVNGNDGTAVRGDFTKPYLTINAAVTAALAGDLVHVRPGAYTATASMSKDNIAVYSDPGVTISYNTTIFQTLTNSTSYSFRGYANLIATGSSARILNISGGTGTSFYLEFNNHSASAAMSSFGTLINGAANVTLFVRQDLGFNCSSGGVAFGNSFTGSRFIGMIVGGVSNSGTGYAFQVRQAGAGGSAYLKATTISATGGGAAVSNDQTASTFYIEADVISGNSAGLSSTSSGTMVVRAKAISASAGPGISCTSSGTIQVNGCDSISGTTAGVSLSNGTVNIVGVRSMSASAGPGVTVSGGSIRTTGCGTLSGSTFGVQVTGGTAVIDQGSVSASAGPGVSSATGTLTMNCSGTISGTTNGITVTSGTATFSNCDAVSASAGAGISASGGTVTVILDRSITGTTSGVNVSGATTIVRAGSVTASAGPGVTISTGTLTTTIFGTITGTTSGVSHTGTGTIAMTARAIVASAGAGILFAAASVGGNTFQLAACTGTTAGINNPATTGTATNTFKIATLLGTAGPALITTACTHTNDFSGCRIVTTNAATAAITHNTLTGTGNLRLRTCVMVATGANSITTSTVGATVQLQDTANSANVAVAAAVTLVIGALTVNALIA